MTRWMPFLAAAFLSWSATAMAETISKRDTFGACNFLGFSAPDNEGCVMSSKAIDVDGEVVMGLTTISQLKLLVGLNRSSWSVPDRMPVSVRFVFSSG